jgi:ankyrin repeat domain-containing protein 50
MIQSWLGPPDPCRNHKIARESQLSGTATWWIHGETFTQWKYSGPSSLLWIHGKCQCLCPRAFRLIHGFNFVAGAGKSVLWYVDPLPVISFETHKVPVFASSSIIQDICGMCTSGLATLGFFYCDYREDQKRHRRGLLSSLLDQFCHQSDAYYASLFKFYLAHDRGLRYPSDSELVHCLKRMLELPGQATAYVIIDALDNCPRTTTIPSPRDDVLDLVEELVKSDISNVRICVTSRAEVDIAPVLDPLVFRSISLHGERGHRQDIAEYIKSVVNTDDEMRRWSARDRGLVIDTLTEKSDGM